MRAFAGGSADYDPADSPKTLTEQLEADGTSDRQVVVRGEVQGFAAGRVYGTADAPDAARTIVMEVKAEEFS